jgi:hypothetical protein
MSIEMTFGWRDIKEQNRWKSLERYIQDPSVWEIVQGDVYALAEKAKLDMEDCISQNRKQPRDSEMNLENAIQVEIITGALSSDQFKRNRPEMEVGIGNIETLNKEAPYWEMINDGHIITTEKTHVVPFRVEDEYRTFVAGSKHTIEGIDYVGYAQKKVEEGLNKIVIDAGETIWSALKNI